MKIKTIETFKFSELSERAKQKALQKFYDINVSFAWWEHVYEDASRCGVKITGFDLDRSRNATGRFIQAPKDCALLIVSEHGEKCETRKTAETYLKDLASLEAEYQAKNESDPEYDFEDDFDFRNAMEDLNVEFLGSILEDYAMILQSEYDHQTSEAQIIESIEANEYDFTANGELA